MFSVNLVFVDSKTMRRLNKKYRRLDKPTTVLSFYYGPTSSRSFGTTRGEQEAGIPIGEIVICPTVAKKQNLSVEKLVSHGLKNILSEISTAKISRIGLG